MDRPQLLMVPVARIRGARMPIRWDDRSASALRQSIGEVGLLQPLIVRPGRGGGYELISGARRLGALAALGEREVPVIVRAADDLDAALMGLHENMQRERLHFLDEARAFQRIIADFSLTQLALSKRLSKSQAYIGNKLRLMQLGNQAQDAVRKTRLSERHARALLRLSDEELQLKALERAHKNRLSVRQLEDIITRWRAEPRRTVSYAIRDGRVLVNTVLGAVKALRDAGVEATGRVVEKGDVVEVIVSWRKGDGCR